MELSHEFRFAAAHRIADHPGKCRALHGHTYRVSVTLSVTKLDGLGMVIDFEVLQDLVARAFLNRWDHATLLRTDDPLVALLARGPEEVRERLVTFEKNPTVETLAAVAFRSLGPLLPPWVRLTRLAVSEAPECSVATRVEEME